jgi:peptidoglycan L-alanyl-D-glutamate endopeptidase CwlK
MSPKVRRALVVAASVALPGGALVGAWVWWMGRKANQPGRTSRWATKARREKVRPATVAKVDAMLAALDAAGIPCVVTDGHRFDSDQGALYAQGRTAPGPIVTNARPGESAHNEDRDGFAEAVDVAPQDASGAPHWPSDPALWERIGKAGERVGLSWGGRWSSPDRPHFEEPDWRSRRRAGVA